MKIVVASENPVKINAVKKAYTRMFPEESFEVVGIPTDSGVPDQPMSNTETLRGAMARAKRASQAHPDALFWVGIEGGLEEKEGEFEAFAWAVVYSHEGMVGKARTGAFFLRKRYVPVSSSVSPLTRFSVRQIQNATKELSGYLPMALSTEQHTTAILSYLHASLLRTKSCTLETLFYAMHHTYRTEGIVLGSAPRGEGSRNLALFTEELGLVYAAARSVRETRSKLRFHLQDYSLTDLSLVRGREVWRLTNAAELSSVTRLWGTSPEFLRTIVRVTSLLQRLLHGEERNRYLFDSLKSLFLLFHGGMCVTDDIVNGEYITVLRILHSLGYLEERREFSHFLASTALEKPLYQSMQNHHTSTVRAINASLKASNL
jgi:DNA repair protein RecO